MSFWHLIYYISWSKVPSKTTLLHGWMNILKQNFWQPKHRRSSTTLTSSKLFNCDLYGNNYWITQNVALAPSFAGLQHFPEGWNFKQWTGDNLKVLMKVWHSFVLLYNQVQPICIQVYLPAIEGHVPDDMVQTMHALLEFCYIAWHNIHDTHSLAPLDDALQQFHHHREIFHTSGACADIFNLPRQHSLIHYVKLIYAYGAPNGLCSSITESKHIKAVKEPWQCSSRFDVLSQMLLTNQCLDKLAAARADFTDHGMLQGTYLSAVWDQILCMLLSFHSDGLLN